MRPAPKDKTSPKEKFKQADKKISTSSTYTFINSQEFVRETCQSYIEGNSIGAKTWVEEWTRKFGRRRNLKNTRVTRIPE
jgi:hypothetical protein